MRKLITLTPAQDALRARLMEETYQDSTSAFVVYLMLAYEQNAKRPVGRPSARTETPAEADTIPMYLSGNGLVSGPMRDKNMYSYNDLVEWYAGDPRRGRMPKRDDLKLHPDYKP